MMKNRFILLLTASIFFSINVFGARPFWHGVVGGSYVFEPHINRTLHGFEINLNRHFSSCTQSHFLNNFGFNILYAKDFQETGVSYTGRLIKKSSIRHGGWDLICKLSPNIIKGLEDNSYMLKPGIGATVYSGARAGVLTQVFALYNYNLFLQAESNVINQNNHSIQIGVFIGIGSFNMRPLNFNRKKE